MDNQYPSIEKTLRDLHAADLASAPSAPQNTTLTPDEDAAVKLLVSRVPEIDERAYHHNGRDTNKALYGATYEIVFKDILSENGFTASQIKTMRPKVLQNSFAGLTRYPELTPQLALNLHEQQIAQSEVELKAALK